MNKPTEVSQPVDTIVRVPELEIDSWARLGW